MRFTPHTATGLCLLLWLSCPIAARPDGAAPPAPAVDPFEKILQAVTGAALPPDPAAKIACPLCRKSPRPTRPCDACVGKGKIDCAPCKGLGRLDCPSAECENGRLPRLRNEKCTVCEGRGWMTCRPCAGTKKVPCVRCKGKGSFPWQCPGCIGKGQLPSPAQGAGCTACKGSHSIACSVCKGKGALPLADCAACGNQGFLACVACKGTAFALCARCNGRGSSGWELSHENCNSCAGHGGKKCGQCTAGAVKCDKCAGNAGESPCWLCDGKKIVDCSVCREGTVWCAELGNGTAAFVLPMADWIPLADVALRFYLHADQLQAPAPEGQPSEAVAVSWWVLIVDNRKGTQPVEWTDGLSKLSLTAGRQTIRFLPDESVTGKGGMKPVFEAKGPLFGLALSALLGAKVREGSRAIFLVPCVLDGGMPDGDLTLKRSEGIAGGPGAATDLAKLARMKLTPAARHVMLESYAAPKPPGK